MKRGDAGAGVCRFLCSRLDHPKYKRGQKLRAPSNAPCFPPTSSYSLQEAPLGRGEKKKEHGGTFVSAVSVSACGVKEPCHSGKAEEGDHSDGQKKK